MLVRMFDQQAIEFLCVLDKDRRLEGLVRRDELFEAFAQGKNPETKSGTSCVAMPARSRRVTQS